MTETMIEVDYGWWLLEPGPLWRMSWCPDDGWLRVYRAGRRDLVVRLGRFADRASLESWLEGWEDQAGSKAWLVGRFPAVRCFLGALGV